MINNKVKKKENIFKNFGPAFLILALGIGSGEFILWPYLSANYGFGILWGALLGISLQLFLIQIISRNTIIFGQDIILSFSKVFAWAFAWVIFSTLVGFGWPGFSALSSSLIVGGFGLSEQIFLPLSIFILLSAGSILVFSKNAYRRILYLEKIAIGMLFLLTIFLFIWYFDLKMFWEMLQGFVGIGDGYNFVPKEFLAGGFLVMFLGAIAYAGSGGNLLLANSFYVLEERKKEREKRKNKQGQEKKHQLNISIKKVFKQNLIFFWGGGIIIISMLSYISYVVLKGVSGINEDFSFLILEAEIFSRDISPVVGYSFIILGAFAIFGVQLGILDFLGRITKHAKNSSEKWKKKISDRKAYSWSIIAAVIFGLTIFALGFEKPKYLIITGAVINAFSMGVIAFLLFLLEVKKVPGEWKSKKVIFGMLFATIFYISFFLFVIFEKFLF